MSQINLNHTTPAAPGGNTNVTWQVDASNNVSAYVPNSTTPLTTKGDILTFAAVAVRLGVGADGTVLTADSAQTDGIKWAAPASASGGLVLLAEYSASNSASIALATRNASGQSGNMFQTDFDEYLVEVLSLVPATNNQDMRLQFSTNGGSTYDSTAGHYAWSTFRWTNAGSSPDGSTSDTAITISAGATFISSTASNGGLSGSFKVFNPLSGAAMTRLRGEMGQYNVGSSLEEPSGFGAVYTQTTAVNAFQVISTSGNITSGTVRVYGIAK